MEADIIIPEDARLRYLERRKKDIESLSGALGSKSFDEFKRVGHQLKGNAVSFGYAELEKIAVQLEVAGDRQDLHEASRQLEAFQMWLKRTLTK